MRGTHGFGLAGLLVVGLVAINPIKASAFPSASGGIYVAQSDIIPVHRWRYRHYRPYRYYYRPYGYYRPYRYHYGPYGYYRPYRYYYYRPYRYYYYRPYRYYGPSIGLYFRF